MTWNKTESIRVHNGVDFHLQSAPFPKTAAGNRGWRLTKRSKKLITVTKQNVRLKLGFAAISNCKNSFIMTA